MLNQKTSLMISSSEKMKNQIIRKVSLFFYKYFRFIPTFDGQFVGVSWAVRSVDQYQWRNFFDEFFIINFDNFHVAFALQDFVSS